MDASGAASARQPSLPRILFLAGVGRSGSTVVSNLLGSASGLTSVGELRYLWQRGLDEHALCGCGRPVPTCEFWQQVLARAYGVRAPDIELDRRVDARLLRLRSLPALVAANGDPARLGADARAYTQALRDVYSTVAHATGGDVIVDSSKLVSFGFLLGRIEGLDVRVVHLVRDPRAVAHSWGRRRARTERGDGDGAMNRQRAAKSAVLWDVWNAAAQACWGRDPARYVRVRYEDFVRDPQRALAPALALFGLSEVTLPVTADGRIELAPTHTVAGNPARMSTGPVALTEDDEWRTAMPARDRALVTALTAPLLAPYGYPLRTGRPATGRPATGRPETGRPETGRPETGRPGPTAVSTPAVSTPAASSPATQPRVFVEDMTGPARTRARVARNVGWIREQGLRRALEEKEIDPLRTVPLAVRKARYRRHSPIAPGAARPVFVVGVQRSGTNMVLRGLGAAPQIEVHNENDRRAFERYKLRPDPVLESIVAGSRHSHVVFKSLCDSHRTPELLDGLHTATAARAVWIHRDMAGRVRSALAKFGDGNVQVLREYAEGVNTTRWHVQRMSDATREFVLSFDHRTMTPASGAALMWLIRNQLYLDLGLAERRDVHLVSYNSFLRDPESTTRRLCAFLEFPYAPALVAHVTARPPTYAAPLDIDPRITERCAQLAAALDRTSTGTSAVA